MIVKNWLFQMCRTSNKKKKNNLELENRRKKKLIVP